MRSCLAYPHTRRTHCVGLLSTSHSRRICLCAEATASSSPGISPCTISEWNSLFLCGCLSSQSYHVRPCSAYGGGITRKGLSRSLQRISKTAKDEGTNCRVRELSTVLYGKEYRRKISVVSRSWCRCAANEACSLQYVDISGHSWCGQLLSVAAGSYMTRHVIHDASVKAAAFRCSQQVSENRLVKGTRSHAQTHVHTVSDW